MTTVGSRLGRTTESARLGSAPAPAAWGGRTRSRDLPRQTVTGPGLHAVADLLETRTVASGQPECIRNSRAEDWRIGCSPTAGRDLLWIWPRLHRRCAVARRAGTYTSMPGGDLDRGRPEPAIVGADIQASHALASRPLVHRPHLSAVARHPTGGSHQYRDASDVQTQMPRLPHDRP